MANVTAAPKNKGQAHKKAERNRKRRLKDWTSLTCACIKGDVIALQLLLETESKRPAKLKVLDGRAEFG